MLYDTASPALTVEDLHPLTPLQRSMLFSHVFDGGEAYIEQLCWTLQGEMDSARLKKAWKKATARHGALRSSVRWENLSQPYQLVYEKFEPLFEETELPEGGWLELEAKERALLPDMRVSSPTRLLLVRSGEKEWRIIWTMHHIVMDGWSAGLFLQDVAALYAEPDLELPPAAQFASYANWIYARTGQDEKSDRAYWQRRLSVLETPTKLLVHEAEGAVKPGAGHGEASFSLTEQESAGLAAAAKSSGVTLAVALQGVTACLLSYYAGQKTVCFGSVTSIRPAEIDGVTGMVGMFVNTLPSVVTVAPEKPLRDWLGTLARHDIEGREHGYIALSEMARLAKAEDPQSFLDVLLVVENMPGRSNSGEPAVFCGCTVGGEKVTQNVRQPLSIIAYPGSVTSIRFAYDGSRFSASAIEGLMQRYRRLLARFTEMAKEPTAMVEQLHPLGPEELELFTSHTLPARPAGFIEADNLLEAFKLRVLAAPDSPACTDEDGTFSYAELDEESSRYGRGFAALGIEPGDSVALFMDKGRPMLAAMLGLFKRGASYCPLDIDYPPARLATMVAASGSKLVLADREAAFMTQTEGEACVVTIAELLKIAAEAGEAREITPAGASRALTLFTSGTTGTPKGMGMTHKGIVEGAAAYALDAGINAQDRVLGQSLPCFDMCAVEILSAIISGAHLVLLPKQNTRPGETLEKAIRQYAISATFMTPSVLKTLAQENVPGLQKLTVAGEKLTADLAAKWMDKVRFAEVYGPAEISFFATSHLLWAGDAINSVGKARYGCAVYVLDAANRVLPPGAAGEICVASSGITSGYINVPAKKQTAFAPNPFWREGASPEIWKNMYRTGDMGWRDASGNIYYLGRQDTQIKLNGVRIEVAEVEALLRALPNVRDAAVIAGEFSPGGSAGPVKLLGAFLVTDEAIDENVIREYLLQYLPNAAIPSVYAGIEEIPLGGTGKLDRNSLAERLNKLLSVRKPSAHSSPASPLEHMMCGLWQEVLNLPEVTRDDHFFRLGGDSIKVLQLSALARKNGLDFHPEQLFRLPVLAHFVLEISGKNAKSETPKAPRPTGNRQKASLSHTQEWLAGLAESYGDGPLWHTAAGVMLKGELQPELLEQAFVLAAKRHSAFKTGWVRGDAGWQAITAEAAPEFRRADLRLAGGLETANRLAAAAFAEPLALDKPPLLRGLLYRITDDQWAWGAVFHRMIADPYSRSLLFNDALAFYRGLASGEAPELRPAQDFAAFVQAEPEAAEDDRNWLEAFIAPRVELAAWSNQSASDRAIFSLPPELADKTEQAARACGETAYIVLVAAMARTLADYTGRESVTFASPLNRRDPDCAEMAGPVSDEIQLSLSAASLQDPARTVRELAEKRNLAVELSDVPLAARLALHSPADYARPDGGAPIAISYLSAEGGAACMAGLDLQQWHFPRYASPYEAVLVFWKHDQALDLLVERRLSFMPDEALQPFFDNFKRELAVFCDRLNSSAAQK